MTGPDTTTIETADVTGATHSVALRNVTKRFDTFTAVDDLSLELGQGEFFTFLGPSGCGKTTTLRMIAGFEQPTAGEVLIEGVNVAGTAPHKRPTNTVFQSYALFPHLSVEKNVAFGLKRKRVSKERQGRQQRRHRIWRFARFVLLRRRAGMSSSFTSEASKLLSGQCPR